MNKILESKNTIVLTLTLFFIHQTYYIYLGGTTYDTNAIRYASKKLALKLILILQGDFNNTELQNVIGEEFGFILFLPAYVIAHSVNIINENLTIFNVDHLFLTEDALINFCMHLVLNIYIIIVLFFVYKLLSNFFNKSYANLFIIFLLLTPSFSGHSLFNLKDIPFALNLLLCVVYFLTKFELLDNSLKFQKLFLPALFISFPALIRLNGLLFSGFVIFYLIIINNKKLRKIHFVRLSFIYGITFIILFLAYPQSWFAFISFLNRAFQYQFTHWWSGATLTNGIFIQAQEMTWNYLLTWYLFKLPVPIILSFIIGTWFLLKKYEFSIFGKFSFVFIYSVFISFSAIRPTAYDGLRQFLFLLPFFIFIFIEIIDKEFINIKISNILLLLIISYFIFTQFGLKETKYTYFNEFTQKSNIAYFCKEDVDGCGNWSTDYWGFTGKSLAVKINSLDTEKEIIVCKPKHAVTSYLDDNVKTLDIEIQNNALQLELPKTFIVATFHRPRYFSDSCYFLENKINFECRNLYTISRKLRTVDIPMSYINECTLN